MFTNAALTGTPTAPTAASGTNNTQIATTAFVKSAISDLVGSSPSTLDTLQELATALGNDPNFATTITTNLSTKAPLASPALTGTPTAPTATAGTNTTQLATTAFVTTAVANKTSVSGNAGTATKLATARNINGVAFDGTTNITVADSTKLPLAGGTMSGGITISTDSDIKWSRNTDYALIGFRNTGDSDTDSYMEFKTGDNSGEYFKFNQVNGSTTTELMTIKSDHLRFKGNTVYHAGNKPTKSDVGLSNVNNWSASTAIDNSSETTYATASAVKTAYDKANHSHPYVPSSSTSSITVLADSDSSSSTDYLSLKAGGNELKIISSAGGSTPQTSATNLTYNGNAIYHAGNVPNKLASTVTFGTGTAFTIDQNEGNWKQKITVSDTSDKSVNRFVFSEDQGTGSYTTLFGINGYGDIYTAGKAVLSNGIWFNKDEGGANISHNDANNETRTGHYTSLDAINFKSDNDMNKVVVKAGYFDASDGIYSTNRIGVNKCTMQYNASTESLDFVFA